LAEDETVTLAVQINGKLRANLEVPKDISKEEALNKAKQLPNVQKWIDGKNIVKEIYVPGKIINIVVK
jgi:leucyl-tRNA synthetase